MADEMIEEVVDETPETEAETPDIASLQAQIARLQSDNEKLRGANTRASADVSRYKKELQAKMTDSEREAAEREEREKQLKERLAELERANAVNLYASSFMSMGYSQELAQKRAELIADGKIAEAMEVEKEFLAEHDKELSASAVKSMSKPPMGRATKPMTREEIMKIKDASARQMAIAENLELFQ